MLDPAFPQGGLAVASALTLLHAEPAREELCGALCVRFLLMQQACMRPSGLQR